MEGESFLLEVPMMNFILGISKEIKWNVKAWYYWKYLDKVHSLDSPGDEMEGQSGFTRSIFDELHSWISKDIKWKVKVVLLEVSLMNFILGIVKEIKW